MTVPAHSDAVTDYWYEHYLDPNVRQCGLCGNCGVIDTRVSAITATGLPIGNLFFCICPNGQAWRAGGANPKAIHNLARRS